MTVETSRYSHDGRVVIDGKPYTIERPPAEGAEFGQLAYKVDFLPEPPWQEGAPPLTSDPTFTWHMGGFKSRQGIPGTSEYGKNTDPRWAFRLLPSPKINVVELIGSTDTPLSIFEAFGYVFVVTEERVYRIDPDTNVATLSANNSGAANNVMGLRWEDDYALVTSDESVNSLFKLELGDIVPGGPDNWTGSNVSAHRLAVGVNWLYKVTDTGELKHIPTGLSPLDEANWADQVQIGDKITPPTALLAYDRSAIVGKPDGMFVVGDDGFGISVIKRMARDDENCYGMELYDPWVLVPHVRGLFRQAPGVIESCGLELEVLNDSPVNGRWKCFSPDAQWLYGFMDVDGETYVNVARDRKSGEPGFGPFTWDTLLWFEEECKASFVSAMTSPARLWFGYGNDVAYIELSNSNGSHRYSTEGGSRYSAKMRYDDWYDKDFPYIDVVGRNISATKYWTVNYSLDGAAFTNVDLAGNVMRTTSNARKRFYLPRSLVGREVQWRWDWASDSETLPPELIYVEAYTRPQAKVTPMYTMQLRLEAGVRTTLGRDLRSAQSQYDALRALSESAASVLASGPWGENSIMWIHHVALVNTIQETNGQPSYIIEIGLQERESA